MKNNINELEIKKRRQNELLWIKEKQVQNQNSKTNNENAEKYKKKLIEMEGHYERRIKELITEVQKLKKSRYLKSWMKSECSKSSNFEKERQDHSFSVNTLQMLKDPEVTRRDEIDLDTDITPAEELDSTDKRKMVENVENIGNDSLLINFYKKKLENKQKEICSDKRQYQNYTDRASVPLKTKDQNSVKEDSFNVNSIYLQSNSQRQLSRYIPKHYQIPKKENSIIMDSQGASRSESSENFNNFKKNKHIKYFIVLIIILEPLQSIRLVSLSTKEVNLIILNIFHIRKWEV